MNLGVLTAFLKPIESNYSKAFSKNTICRWSCCLYGQENRRIHTITLLCSNTHYLPKGWEQILTRATGRLFLLTRIKVLPNKERIPYWGLYIEWAVLGSSRHIQGYMCLSCNLQSDRCQSFFISGCPKDE